VNGERVRVIGRWIIDPRGVICVEAHAIHPAERRKERAITGRRAPMSQSASW
jgi:hypothetical protein